MLQAGLVNLINFLQEQPDWSSTAVIIAYDDSDGWYDHAFIAPNRRRARSRLTMRCLNGAGNCGTWAGVTPEPNGRARPAGGGRRVQVLACASPSW